MKINPRIWLLLGTLYIVYILYITLLPFNFSVEVIQSNLGNIEWTKRFGSHLFLKRNFDAIANILFFIPLGIIINNTLYALRQNRIIIKSLFIATLSGLFLSFIIEMSQLFIEARTTSLIDILMNTIGCFLGALLAQSFTFILSNSNRDKISHFMGKLPTVLFLIPFLLISLLLNENIPLNFLKSGKVERIYFSWEYLIKPSWIWLIFYVYIPIGILMTHIVKNHFKHLSFPLHYILSFIIAEVIIVSTELVKYSGDFASIPIGNIVSGIFGLIVGILIHELLPKNISGMQESERLQKIYILSGLLLLFGSIILYKSAYPLKFNVSHDYILNKSVFSLLSTYSFVPFSGFLKLFIYTIQNMLLFIPIGMALSEFERYIDFKKNTYILVIISAVLIIISFILKIMNENQIPFLFELPTNVFGIFLGYFIWYAFRRGKQTL